VLLRFLCHQSRLLRCSELIAEQIDFACLGRYIFASVRSLQAQEQRVRSFVHADRSAAGSLPGATRKHGKR
jgi:hypothetical protein